MTAGKFYGDAEKDKGKQIMIVSLQLLTYSIFNWTGIQTSQDAKFYARTAKFDETFNNEGKSLVVQFSVKHEQKIDCGGGYVKVSIYDNLDIFGNDILIYYLQVFPSTLDPKEMEGESKYNIMFGKKL